MGLSEAYAEALSEFHSEPSLEASVSPADLESKFEAQSQRVGRLRLALKKLKSTESELIPAIRRDMKKGIFSESLLDGWIDDLLEMEKTEREFFAPQIRHLEKRAKDTLNNGFLGPKRIKYADIFRAQAKAYQGLIEHLRDSRWRLIALRAEIEDPGDSPVFDNPESLALYLQQHK